MTQQINLVNPLLLKKRYAFGLREMGVGVVLVLTAALAWGAVLHYQAGVLEHAAAEQEARQAAAQQALDRLTALANRPVSALLTERVEAARVKAAQREALLKSIGGVIQTTSAGFAPRLRALGASSTQGVWLNEFTVAPGYLALKGSSLNAYLLTAYMDRLGKQASFAGMQFSGIEAAQPNPGPARPQADRARPEHIDFVLVSGTRDKLADQGNAGGK